MRVRASLHVYASVRSCARSCVCAHARSYGRVCVCAIVCVCGVMVEAVELDERRLKTFLYIHVHLLDSTTITVRQLLPGLTV